MASLFEQMGALDRPNAPVKIKVGKVEVSCVARRPSSYEQDVIDAVYMDEYGRILQSKMIATEGKLPERERVRAIYATRPKSDIITQLLPSLKTETTARAADLAGIDLGAERLKMLDMSDDERDAYGAEKNAEFDAAIKLAEDEKREELNQEPHDELVNRLVEINVNLQSNMLAKKSVDPHYLFFTCFAPTEDGSLGDHAFPSAEWITKNWTADTIEAAVAAVQKALHEADADLPLESPGALEPDGQASLPDADTTPTSGAPTTTAPDDSK